MSNTHTKAKKSKKTITNMEWAIKEYGKTISKPDAVVWGFHGFMMTHPEEYGNKSIDDVSKAEFVGWMFAKHK